MKLIKDKVVKNIEDRLVGDYISAGWKIYKEEKKKPVDTEKEEETFVEKRYSRFRKEE